jgi:hypothetical protein
VFLRHASGGGGGGGGPSFGSVPHNSNQPYVAIYPRAGRGGGGASTSGGKIEAWCCGTRDYIPEAESGPRSRGAGRRYGRAGRIGWLTLSVWARRRWYGRRRRGQRVDSRHMDKEMLRIYTDACENRPLEASFTFRCRDAGNGGGRGSTATRTSRREMYDTVHVCLYMYHTCTKPRKSGSRTDDGMHTCAAMICSILLLFQGLLEDPSRPCATGTKRMGLSLSARRAGTRRHDIARGHACVRASRWVFLSSMGRETPGGGGLS